MAFRGAEKPSASLLPDGHRLHLRHGPIDLVIGADGNSSEVAKAYRQASAFFETVLETLVGELGVLRQPCRSRMPRVTGEIARDMQARALAFAHYSFVTPMIAVAGAVADHVLRALLQDRRLDRAYVNNGGDIALWLGRNANFDIGVCSDPDLGVIGTKVRINHDDGIGGIATSGWQGRSFSMGIADAVTVLAGDAASADAAATLLANAVDLPGSPNVRRRSARELDPDSDLGDRPVTVAVGTLTDVEVRTALANGKRVAADMVTAGQIRAAYLALQGRSLSCEQRHDRERLCNRSPNGNLRASAVRFPTTPDRRGMHQ